ncbi:MAG: GNAT family N-acetyltransferase [Lachnospiraceae bacterium]|nr:GNAT family N-acetyltransferase [Lachnospiraceae bacterium]
MDNSKIMRIALEQSAYDCCCAPEDFVSADNSVHVSKASDRARRYLELPHICNLVSYGTNIVATGREDLFPEIERCISHMPAIENCFETPGLYPLNKILEKEGARICFMAEYFLPDIDEVFRYDRSCADSFEFRVMEAVEFEGLYLPEWKNALCADRRHLDRLAVGAFDQGILVGLAGCSADCDTMWQIGVDVLPEYRRKGIASALTNRLARETFERDLVPFYCAAWSNVKSVRNAIRSGFRPGWVEATAKSDAYIENMLKKG